jgi:hypothetical protein
MYGKTIIKPRKFINQLYRCKLWMKRIAVSVVSGSPSMVSIKVYVEAQVTYSLDSFQSSFTLRGKVYSVSVCIPRNVTKEHFPSLSVSRLAPCPQQLDLRINNKQPSHPMPFPPHPLFFILTLSPKVLRSLPYISFQFRFLYFYALFYFGLKFVSLFVYFCPL